jgi:DNA-binding NarL/FixJ family response regulator
MPLTRSTLLRLVRAGCNAAEIAAGLGIHLETVERDLAALDRTVRKRLGLPPPLHARLRERDARYRAKGARRAAPTTRSTQGHAHG